MNRETFCAITGNRLLVTLLLALALPGCGSDDPTPAATPSQAEMSPTTTSAVTMGGGLGTRTAPPDEQHSGFRNGIALAFDSEALQGATVETLSCDQRTCRLEYRAEALIPVRQRLASQLSELFHRVVAVHETDENTLLIEIPGESMAY